MLTSKTNILIIYHDEESAQLALLKKKLENDDRDIRDLSINCQTLNDDKNRGQIKKQLRKDIEWAGVIILIISPSNTENYDCVDSEIRYARQLKNKRIIGIWKPQHYNMPAVVEDYADALVNWDDKKINDTIINEQDIWTDPDGHEAPVHSIKRIQC